MILLASVRTGGRLVEPVLMVSYCLVALYLIALLRESPQHRSVKTTMSRPPTSLRFQDRVWVLGPMNAAQSMVLLALIGFGLLWLYMFYLMAAHDHGEEIHGRTGRRLAEQMLDNYLLV